MSQEQQMPTTGRWGWYRDHNGTDARRVSKLLEYGETKPGRYNIERWQERQVALGMAARPDLLLAVKAIGAEPETGWTRAQKDQLTALAGQAQEAAKSGAGATKGTAIHTFTERIDRGEPIESVVAGLGPVDGRTLRAYEAMRRLNGWRTVEIERTVWLEELEVRGTFDRIDYVPGLATLLGPGDCQYGHAAAGLSHPPPAPAVGASLSHLPVIVDVKTEKDPTLGGIHIAPQLAIYSRARKMWRPTGGTHIVTIAGQDYDVPNGEYVPTPCVRQDVAIVVHLRDGDANPLFVNLAEGWEAALADYEQMRRESRAKRKVGAAGAWFAPMPNVKQPAPAELLVAEAVAAGEGRPDRPMTGAEPVGTVVSVGGIDFTKHGRLPALSTPVEVAVRDEHGNVRWESTRPVDLAHAGTTQQFVLACWQAVDVDGLSAVWKAATAAGLTWGGALAMAGDARRRQIGCPQRQLHTGGGACACGWVAGQLP